jgi:hypothetical protein
MAQLEYILFVEFHWYLDFRTCRKILLSLISYLLSFIIFHLDFSQELTSPLSHNFLITLFFVRRSSFFAYLSLYVSLIHNLTVSIDLDWDIRLTDVTAIGTPGIIDRERDAGYEHEWDLERCIEWVSEWVNEWMSPRYEITECSVSCNLDPCVCVKTTAWYTARCASVLKWQRRAVCDTTQAWLYASKWWLRIMCIVSGCDAMMTYRNV